MTSKGPRERCRDPEFLWTDLEAGTLKDLSPSTVQTDGTFKDSQRLGVPGGDRSTPSAGVSRVTPFSVRLGHVSSVKGESLRKTGSIY